MRTDQGPVAGRSGSETESIKIKRDPKTVQAGHEENLSEPWKYFDEKTGAVDGTASVTVVAIESIFWTGISRAREKRQKEIESTMFKSGKVVAAGTKDKRRRNGKRQKEKAKKQASETNWTGS